MTVPELFLDVSSRATVLLAPALLLARYARQPSAATRHLVCSAALLLALALPVLRDGRVRGHVSVRVRAFSR